MSKTEKFKIMVKRALLREDSHLPLKGITPLEVITPERDSIPLLFLNIVIETAFLHSIRDREYNPLNVVFIAKSGIGKSRLLQTLRYLDFVYYCEEITPKHLKGFLELVKEGKKRFLVIPDFNSITQSHGRKTQKTTLSILRMLMSDGITNLASYGMEFSSKFPVKAGVLTAMTISNYAEFRLSWKKSGFLNRFLPYSFRHGIYTEEQIIKSIFYQDDIRFIKPKPYTIIKNIKINEVKMNGEILQVLEHEAKQLSEICEATPYRDVIRLVDLIRVYVILLGDRELTLEHVIDFRKIIRYVNYSFNEM